MYRSTPRKKNPITAFEEKKKNDDANVWQIMRRKTKEFSGLGNHQDALDTNVEGEYRHNKEMNLWSEKEIIKVLVYLG